MLSMTYVCIYMYKVVFIYNYVVHRWHNWRYLLMDVIHVVCYWVMVYCLWCAFVWKLYHYGSICVTVWCPTISLYHPSYNTSRYGFCLAVLCLSGNPASFIVYACYWPVTCCFCVLLLYCNCNMLTVLSYVMTGCMLC